MTKDERHPSNSGKWLTVIIPIAIGCLWIGRAAIIQYKEAHPTDTERMAKAVNALAERRDPDYCAATDKQRWLENYKAKYQRDLTPKPDCK